MLLRWLLAWAYELGRNAKASEANGDRCAPPPKDFRLNYCMALAELGHSIAMQLFA